MKLDQIHSSKIRSGLTSDKHKSYSTDTHDQAIDDSGDGLKPTGNKSKVNTLGVGMEAVVFTKDKESWQGTVRKWVKNQPSDIERSGTINYLIQGNQANNYMVPKVYSIKKLMKQNGICDYYIDMEQLHPIDQIDIQLRNAALQSVFETHVEFEKLHNFFRAFEMAANGAHDSMVIGTNIYKFKKEVVDAFKIIKACAEKSGARVDIHLNNLMIRRSNVGAQIVISDPLYSGPTY
jgi:hypothetical protein